MAPLPPDTGPVTAGFPLAGTALAATAVTGWWLTGHLRATPAGFPGPFPEPGQKAANRDRYTKVWRSES